MEDPSTSADFGDGLLMREGYTIVWLGWEFDVPPPRLRLDAPRARLPSDLTVEPLAIDIVVNERVTESLLVDEPLRPSAPYPPADPRSPTDVLTVRDRFWDAGEPIARERWQFATAANGLPVVRLDGGFDPGRWYRVTYRASNPVVAGVGLAAIRDAASAFRYRTDLPIRGTSAYAFGQSQTGRLLREFLYEGFNVDERERRVFDGLWIHIAGAARGTFNDRFATPASGDQYRATQFPFADAEETDVDGTGAGLQSIYAVDKRPKVFYTNTPVEYWGGGRAAALTHTSVDGKRDLVVPDNVRMYLLAGAQHLVAPFPPGAPLPPDATGDQRAAARSGGQQLGNPLPQANAMRGLLRAWHAWIAEEVAPPPSRYPRRDDGTLVDAGALRFPSIPGVADPRTITGPAREVAGRLAPLPFLVPAVDSDGNETAGIRDPELAVPLATTTGWNFRSAQIGNPGELMPVGGSYIPFALTRAERERRGDPRPSIEERYRDRADYVERIRAAANELIRERYMLAEDLDVVLERAEQHWDFATRGRAASSGIR